MLGIVGAGGIGYELQSSFRMFEYERVSAIIILIFATIFVIDHLSSFVRSKIKVPLSANFDKFSVVNSLNSS